MRFSVFFLLAAATSFVVALPATSQPVDNVAATANFQRDFEDISPQPLVRRGKVASPKVIVQKLDAFKKTIPAEDEWKGVSKLATKIKTMMGDGTPFFETKKQVADLSVEVEKLGETGKLGEAFHAVEIAFGFDV